MNRGTICMASVFAFAAVTGCKPGPHDSVVVDVVKPPALDRAKAILKGYESGQPFSSEEIEFPEIVAELKTTDPAKAAILGKGFKEIKENHNSESGLKQKAKELLSKI